MDPHEGDSPKPGIKPKLSQAALQAINDRSSASVPLTMSRTMQASNGDKAAQDARFAYLKAKFQVGSCKGPISFSSSESVFHPDDIPVNKQESKKEVAKWKSRARANRVGASSDWNISVEHPDPINCMRRRVRTNADHDRPLWIYNYRSEKLPPKALQPVPKPHKFKVDTMTAEEKATIRTLKLEDPVLGGNLKRTQEYPNHPDLEAKTPWRTQEFTPAETRTIVARQISAHRQNSEKTKSRLKKYVSPQQRYKERLTQIRQLKEDGVNIAYQTAADSSDLIPTYNRLACEPSNKTRAFHHSGVYEFNDIEGRWMWSDTGSFDREGPGDVVKTHNPSAFNFASPTSS